MASLYWTITTLTTTGYGDIIPIDNKERIMNIAIMLVGATVFGYVVANISTIVQEFNAKNAAANERIGMLKEYLSQNACPKSVSKDIVGYVRQLMRKHTTYDDKLILRRLPAHLRTCIQIEDSKALLDAMPIFKHLRSDSIKLLLLDMLTFCSAAKGHRVVKDGDAASEILLVTQGRAVVCRILEVNNGADKKSRAALRGFYGGSGPRSPAQRLIARMKPRGGSGHKGRPGAASAAIAMAPLDYGIVAPADGEFDVGLRARRAERSAVARGRWRKVRESLALIVAMGRDETKFLGITQLVKPPRYVIDILMDDARHRPGTQTPPATAASSSGTAADAATSAAAIMAAAAAARSGKGGGPSSAASARVVKTAVSAEDEVAACEIEELGEIRAGDVFGFHAMRLSVPHACTVVATEPFQYYSLARADLMALAKVRVMGKI